MKLVEGNKYQADEGKIFYNANDNIFYGDSVSLGTRIDKEGNTVKEVIGIDIIEIDIPNDYVFGGHKII